MSEEAPEWTGMYCPMKENGRWIVPFCGRKYAERAALRLSEASGEDLVAVSDGTKDGWDVMRREDMP